MFGVYLNLPHCRRARARREIVTNSVTQAIPVRCVFGLSLLLPDLDLDEGDLGADRTHPWPLCSDRERCSLSRGGERFHRQDGHQAGDEDTDPHSGELRVWSVQGTIETRRLKKING